MTDFAQAEQRANRFAGDTGAADPFLRALLAAPWGEAAQRAIVDRLAAGRLLLPVVAEQEACTGSAEDDDCGDACAGTCEDDGHLTAVTVADAQGRSAMLCFSGVDALAAWRPEARPVPVAGPEAAQSALQADCVALVVDAGNEHRFALAGTGLWALAAGGPWWHPLDDPDVSAALQDTLAAVGVKTRLVRDRSTIDGVAVVLAAGADPDAASAAARALAELPAVRARVSSLEVRWDTPGR